MKSIRWFHLVIATVLVCSLPRSAYPAVTLSVEGASGVPGGTVDVKVKVDDPTPIAGATFTMAYDTGHLSLLSIVDGSFFHVFFNGPEIPGIGTRISGARGSTGALQDTLLILRFRIKTDAESASGYVTGSFSVAIVETEVLDPPAGYPNPQGLTILTGLDPSEDFLRDPDRAFPRLVTYPQSGRVHVDRDADGLSDDEESVLGTDRDQADTDRDGLPDGWEVEKGLDPKDVADAFFDRDSDGFSNLREFLSGTDPKDAEDTPPSAISDMDSDGDVDGVDLAIFSSDLMGVAREEGAVRKGDLDQDGDVDERDLFLAAEEFGRP